MKIFGVSLGTLVLVIVVALLVRKFGGMVPVLNTVSAS